MTEKASYDQVMAMVSLLCSMAYHSIFHEIIHVKITYIDFFSIVSFPLHSLIHLTLCLALLRKAVANCLLSKQEVLTNLG